MRRATSIVFPLLLFLHAAPLSGEFQQTPPPSLKLHLSMSDGLRSSGVQPIQLNVDALTFNAAGERAAMAAKEDAAAHVVAEWPVQKLFTNAQGGISFWAKTTMEAADVAKPGYVTVAKVVETGGGTFVIQIREGEHLPDKNNNVASEAELPELQQQGFSLKDESSLNEAKSEAANEFEKAEQSIGEFQCRLDARLFNIGVDATAAGEAPVYGHSREQWHHVLITWRSVHCTIYIDGKPRGSSKWLSRLEPFTSSKGKLQLVASPGTQLSDVRVYSRALEDDSAGLLAEARQSDYLAPLPTARVWAEWGRFTGRAVVYADVAELPAAKAELSCVETATDRVLRAEEFTSFPNGIAESVVDVTGGEHFSEGVYRFEVTVFDEAGNKLAESHSATWHAKAMTDHYQQFIGSRAGLDKKHKIIPPFTAIEVDGNVVKAVLRDHTLASTGFFRSIVARNPEQHDGGAEELLDGPVALHVFVDGETKAFVDAETGPVIASHETEAEWTATSTLPAGHRLQVNGRMEYDGVTRFDVSFQPKGSLEVDSIELRIPLRHEVLKLLHSVGSGFIHRFLKVWDDGKGQYKTSHLSWAYGGTTKPHRKGGVIFDAFYNHNTETNPWRFSTFVHVGNFYRGLSWFCDNDQGWVHDTGNVPNMEIVANGDDRFIRLNVVAKKTRLNGPLQFHFYLLANPFKPLPKDWRTWVIGDYQKPLPKTKHRFWWHWGEYSTGFRPYPGGGLAGEYEDWIGKFKNDEVVHAPFINFGTPGGSGLFIEEAKVLPFTWKTHTNRPVNDYIAYWMERSVREIGIRGVYVDEPYVQPYSWNVLAGDAPYIADDGTRRPGTRWMEGRQYFRRLKQVFADHDIPHSVWVHTSHWKGLPQFTFIDISMDGEFPSIWVKSFDNYHHFYGTEDFQRGYESGIPYGFVGSQMLNANFNPNTFPENWKCSRTYLAVTLPYSVLPQGTNLPDELYRIQNIRDHFDIYDEDLEELPYFDRKSWLPNVSTTPEIRLGGTLNRRLNEALLYAVAPKSSALSFQIDGGFDSLDLGKHHTHAWNAESGVSLAVDGETRIDQTFVSDVTAVLVRGTDTAQKSRPDGVLLGASFDNGIEPDFGGGIVPAVTKGKQLLFTDGRSGNALAIGHESGEAGYPVVPSWVEGSVEFDLNIQRASAKPVRLIGMRHHLDFDLFVTGGGMNQPAKLVLRTVEIPPAKNIGYATGKLVTEVRSMSAKVEAGKWSRIVLSWQGGQYSLFVNGERTAQLTAPAAARLRTSEAMVPGIWVGDRNAPPKVQISIDSLLCYDWALDESSTNASTRNAMSAATRKPRKQFPIWLWAKEDQAPTEFSFAVHFHQHPNWQSVEAVTLQLFRKDDPKTPLASARVTPWLGTATTQLTPSAAVLDVSKAASINLLDDTDEAEDDLESDEEIFLLRVKLLARQGKKEIVIGERKVSFEAGIENPSREY